MTLIPAKVTGGEGVPPEPDWSDIFADVLDVALAHEEWGVVIREMQEAQTVAVANGHAIRRMVHFRVMYERALRQVAEEGTIVKAKKSRVPRHNPHWVVMRQADDAIRLLEAELGIAPVRRSKATRAQKRLKSERAADAYLKQVAK